MTTQHIQLRRGTAADLPTGGTIAGEPRFTTDTGLLYVDDGTKNVLIGGISYETNALTDYGSGTSFTDATVTAALTALGTTNKATLLLSPGTWVFNENIDYSTYTNVTFRLPPGAIISHGTYTLNIPNVDAGLYQIFTGAGAVTLSGNINEVYPEWWGTNTAPGTTDMADAINAALISGAGRTVRLQGETYLVGSKISMSYPGTALRGVTAEWGSDVGAGTRLLGASTLDVDYIFEVKKYSGASSPEIRSVYVSDIGIHCPSGCGSGGMAIYGAYDSSGFERINCVISAADRTALLLSSGVASPGRSSVMQTTNFNSIWAYNDNAGATAPATKIYGLQECVLSNVKSWCNSASNAAMDFWTSASVTMLNCSYVNTLGYGLHIIGHHTGCYAVDIINPIFENCLNTIKTSSLDIKLMGTITAVPDLYTTVNQPADGSTATGVVWFAAAGGVYVHTTTGTFAVADLYDSSSNVIGAVTSLEYFENKFISLKNPRTLGASTVGDADGGAFSQLQHSEIDLPWDNAGTTHAYTIDTTVIKNKFKKYHPAALMPNLAATAPGNYGQNEVHSWTEYYENYWKDGGEVVPLAETDADMIVVSRTSESSYMTVSVGTGATEQTIYGYGAYHIRIYSGTVSLRRIAADTWTIEYATGRVWIMDGVNTKLSTRKRIVTTTPTATYDTQQLDESTVVNTGAGESTTITMTAAGCIVGTRFSAVKVANQVFRFDPDTDTILGSTSGKYIQLDNVGSAVIMEKIGTSTWAVIASTGTISFESA